MIDEKVAEADLAEVHRETTAAAGAFRVPLEQVNEAAKPRSPRIRYLNSI